ncbi:MAG: VWA domain-containing protein, partial [Methanoculleus bourgensis]|nr:VWA domain-containing protein [Methanoculleus bourgensis]
TRGCYVTRDINLTWKNYPYISVETEVSNETVAVNETVDVTIRLKGDGYAMYPDPIDVVLVIDTSGSMTGGDVSPTRMAAAKAAAKDFVKQMSLTTGDGDRVALVSFACNANLDQNLTRDSDEINGAIDSLSPVGATNMRLAYYTAIKHLKENGRQNAIKAVILMGDGDWNYHGSPLAKGVGYADNNRYLTSDFYYSPYWAPLSGYRWPGDSYSFSDEKYEWYHDLPEPKGDANDGRYLGYGKWYDTATGNWVSKYSPYSRTCENGQFTNQNMSVYANSGGETEKVKIYSIGFASVLKPDVERDLTILSTATGGKYVWAKDEAALKNVYTDIAGELKTNASVDTEMNVVFENVMVNKTFESGADVFDYIHEDGISTTIESWIDNGTEKQPVIDRHTRDDTLNWTSTNPHLPFDIGTMRLNQTWETKFRLKVLADGNINIFGPGSNITFNNGNETLTLPDTFITAVPDLTNTGITSSSLAVVFTGPGTGSGPYTDLVPLNWTTAYKGTEEVDISLAYSRYEDMRSPTTFHTKTLPPGSFVTADNTTTDSTMMPVKDLSPGQYWITVTASARDAETDEDTINVWAHTKGAPRAYIKIG